MSQKQKYRDPETGLHPFVKLIEAFGTPEHQGYDPLQKTLHSVATDSVPS